MIKQVGSTIIELKHRASCHCGAVVLELDLPNGIVDPSRCNCSICRRKGAVVAAVPLSALRVVKGASGVLKVWIRTRFQTFAPAMEFTIHRIAMLHNLPSRQAFRI